MKRFAWLDAFNALLQQDLVMVARQDKTSLYPAYLMTLHDVEDWGRIAQSAKNFGCRWAGVWADQVDEQVAIRAAFVYRGDYLVIQVSLDISHPVMPSHTPYFEVANRMERHLQDMYGILLSDHPDMRRWTRHCAWAEDRFPMRNTFPRQGEPVSRGKSRTPSDSDYPMRTILGASVYQIPVGPVHAGIIEPGHFRFHAVGENVLSLEQRLGYVHKGIEKIAEGRDAEALARLAARVSGDSTVAHAWCACQAMERAQHCQPSQRSIALRALAAERERIANHLGDIGAICNDVGFAFAHMQFSRLRECWLRENERVYKHRLIMDYVVPGGVSHDIGDEDGERMLELNSFIAQELKSLLPILFDHPSLEDRLLETGVLTPELAAILGVTGFVGKASGVDYDVRRDHAYAPYDSLDPSSPLSRAGDVAARLQIRVEEIHHSLKLIENLLALPRQDDVDSMWPLKPGVGQGIGLIEGWRGEIISYVRFDDAGKIARFFPRDPSWFSWPALEHLIHGNIVPDFPVCNKSVNASYSGHDL